MKQQIKSTVTLVCICAVVALMLAVINFITAPTIAENERIAVEKALLEVMPEGKNFEKMDIGGYGFPASITEVYAEDGGGHVFKLTGKGYSSGMIIMCGVNADGTISGVVCLSSGETLGYEKTFGESFVGKDAAGVESVELIAGATKTTEGYKRVVRDALKAAEVFGIPEALEGGAANE